MALSQARRLLGTALRRLRSRRIEPGDVINDVPEVTPAWLTRVLREQGVLSGASVTRVRWTRLAALTASVARVHPSYSGDLLEAGPDHLVLKSFVPDPGASGLAQERLAEAGRREVDFYDVVARAMATMTAPPVARCFHARYSSQGHRAHVLLEDLSETHSAPPWPVPPERAQCEQAVGAIARYHAFWWEHPRLGRDVGEVPGEAQVSAFVRELEEKFPAFVDFLGDRLSIEHRALYERFFASAIPRLLTPRGGGSTLLHGDATWWNVLYPRDPAKDHARLIDWQFWRIGVGTDDMIGLVAIHLDPDRRRALERDLLSRYHARLEEAGVTRYGWSDCWSDYRESAIRHLPVPIWQWSVGMPAHVWWTSLDRILRACADLGCGELV
ncbi:MAG TPA: hypothetical protein VEH80_05950 [Candidatus Bathyarchaeia archaeon]|nr:hypothetical protein [Candidatus Bathyarchaeia archaeon]